VYIDIFGQLAGMKLVQCNALCLAPLSQPDAAIVGAQLDEFFATKENMKHGCFPKLFAILKALQQILKIVLQQDTVYREDLSTYSWIRHNYLAL